MRRLLVLLLTVCTGFSGLVYEVTWQRYLATLLGSHSEATAAVLGIFLAGLSAGYSLFGRVTRRLVAASEGRAGGPRLLLWYGAVEAGIGLWALAFPWTFAGVQALSYALPHGAGGLGFAFDVGLSVVLIGPPTVLMGGTIPMLTQALSRSAEEATRFHAFVYAFNTAGAFAGALAAGFVLIPALGLVRVLVAMAAINLGAGALLAWWGRRGASVVSLALAAEGAGGRRLEGRWSYVAAAGLSGFAMMGIQTVLIRLGGLSFGSSEFTFATVVAVFVLCIALGSFGVSALRRIPRGLLVVNQWLLLGLLGLLYGWLDEGPYWAHVLRTQFGDSASEFYPYFLSGFAGIALVIGLPVALSGATLPLLFHQMRREVSDLGSLAGTLYSWNTLGSLLGALLGGYALLFWLDLHAVYRVALAALAAVAALLTARVYGRPRWAAGSLALALAALLALPAWSVPQLSSGLFRKRTRQPYTGAGAREAARGRFGLVEHVFYRDDPVASVAVVQGHTTAGGVSRAVLVNGKSDGSTGEDYPTMALAGLLPALLAERAERAFVIGYGTGVTAGELAQLEGMREVVVAEISQGVIDAAPWFDFANFHASRDPRVRIVRSDAYRALRRSRGVFDVISSEPSNPWVTGVEMLFSREFLEAARARLAPGGVYLQWYHQYETDSDSVALVLRTYASVFDHVAVWYSTQTDLLLIGLRDGSVDLARIERRAARPDFAAGLARCGIASFPELLAHELVPLGVLHAAHLRGPIHTLLHPILSHVAGRAFFSGGAGQLPFTGVGAPAEVGARASLARRYASERGLDADERFELVTEACRYRRELCLPWLAASYGRSPETARRVEDWLRRPGQMVGGVVVEKPEAMTHTLGAIAGELEPLFAEGAALEPDQLAKASRRYRKYYQHAVPFDPAQLRRAVERCASSSSEACRTGVESARRLLDGAG